MKDRNSTSTSGSIKKEALYICTIVSGSVMLNVVELFLVVSVSGGFKFCIQSVNPPAVTCLERTLVKPTSPTYPRLEPSLKFAGRVPLVIWLNTYPSLRTQPVVMRDFLLHLAGGEHHAL